MAKYDENNPPKIALHIGPLAVEVRENVPVVTNALLQIMATTVADAVKLAAIDTIKGMATVSDVSVTNCSFEN